MFGDVVRELAPGYVEAPEADRNQASAWPAAGSAWPNEAAVWASGGTVDCSIDLGALSGGELKKLVAELATERARIEGHYLAAVGELASRNGAQSAACILRDQTRMNCAQARSEARLAESLVAEGFTDTLAAMQSGEIHMSHARVIAREAPKKHRRNEDDFLELARVYPSDTIARHPLAYRSQQVEADLAAEAAAEDLGPLDAELAMQRHERSASLRMGDDGMWHLRGKFDFLTGRELSTALEAQLRSLRRRAELDSGNADGAHSGPTGDSTHNSNAGNNGPMPTRRQLLADALSELVAGTASARHAKNNLIIVADYDATSDRLVSPRLDDGTPLSAQMLVEHANDAQRLILAVRDGGCIGCRLTSEHTQAHHIDHYGNGGLTDIPNLASMCQPCHRNLHTHGHKIHTPLNGRPRLQSPEPRDTESFSQPPTDAAAAARSP